MIPSSQNIPHSLPDCDAVGELLSAYLDGELTTGKKEAVEAHLQTCDACRLLAEALGSLRTEISSAELTPPPALRSTIMKQIHRENRLRRIRRLTTIGSVGAAAMLCLVIMGNAVLGSLTAADDAAPEMDRRADADGMAYANCSAVAVMDATIEAEIQRAGTAAPAGKGTANSVITATTPWTEEILEPMCTEAPEEAISGGIVAAILPRSVCVLSLEEALKQSTLTFAPSKAEGESASAADNLTVPDTLLKMVQNPRATLAEQQLGVLCTVELTDGDTAIPYVYDLTDGRRLTLADFLGEAMEELAAIFPLEPSTPFCPSAEGLILYLTMDEVITLVWDAFPVLAECISRFAMDAPPLLTPEGARIIP